MSAKSQAQLIAEIEANWESSFQEFLAMDFEQQKHHFKRATKYRSGPDSCNSAYLGGMGAATITRLLGGSYGDGLGIDALVDKASESILLKAAESDTFKWIWDHYNRAGRKLKRFGVVEEY